MLPLKNEKNKQQSQEFQAEKIKYGVVWKILPGGLQTNQPFSIWLSK